MSNSSAPLQAAQMIQYLSSLVDNAGVCIITVDLNGIIVAFNTAAAAFYGYSAEDMIGQPLAKLVRAYARTDHDRAAWVASREARSVELQTEHVGRGDKTLQVRVTFSPIKGESATVIGISLFCIEVGEQVSVLNALQQERDVLEAILETTNDAIIMINTSGRVLAMNLQFETFFHLPRFQAVGSSLDELLAKIRARPDLPPEFANLLVTLAHDAYRSGGGDFSLPEPDRRVLMWYSTPVAAHDGAPMGRLWAFHDVTHEREVERMKTEFLSLISHELRTPLTSIVGFNEMVLDGDAGEINDEVRSYLEIIRLNAERLRVLIDDILDLTKIESGHVELHAASHDLAAIIQGVAVSMRPVLERHQQVLTVNLKHDLPPVWADKDRLVQILSNLLSNASKYSDDDKRIDVAVKVVRGDDDLPASAPRLTLPAFLIEVADEGIGIDEKDQPHIFTSFFRTEEVSRRQIQGSGLGLTIVKSFVELHGGRIWLQSEVNRGTIFYFTIPIVKGI